MQLIGMFQRIRTGITQVKDLPKALTDYIQYLEKALGVPVKYLSVGPDRTQTLILQ